MGTYNLDAFLYFKKFILFQSERCRLNVYVLLKLLIMYYKHLTQMYLYRTYYII